MCSCFNMSTLHHMLEWEQDRFGCFEGGFLVACCCCFPEYKNCFLIIISKFLKKGQPCKCTNK